MHFSWKQQICRDGLQILTKAYLVVFFIFLPIFIVLQIKSVGIFYIYQQPWWAWLVLSAWNHMKNKYGMWLALHWTRLVSTIPVIVDLYVGNTNICHPSGCATGEYQQFYTISQFSGHYNRERGVFQHEGELRRHDCNFDDPTVLIFRWRISGRVIPGWKTWKQ